MSARRPALPALLLGALLTLVALTALAAPARANQGPVFDDADATELAQSLADAYSEQNVCYGWRVDVQDDGSGESGVDIGSSQGPFEELDVSQCADWVLLNGTIHWTSESSESSDSSDVWIESSLDDPPTLEELEALGAGKDFFSGGPIHGDDGDVVVFNIMQALPALVAEHGEAPYVPFETSSAPVSEQGEPTDKPGSDILRQYWPTILAAIGLIVGGLLWLGLIVMHHFDTDWTGSRQSPRSAEENPTWPS